jgi:hypothetical protein
MYPPVVFLAACILGAGGTTMAADAPAPLVIADFEQPEVLTRLIANDGTEVSLTDKDVTSGARALEVRVKPFSQHGNHWPYVFLIDRYFETPVDLSRHSRLTVSVRNVTEGLATVRITLSSKPYNDGGRNLEGETFIIPGGSTMACNIPTSLFRQAINDPSAVQALMIVFPANETDAIYRIDAIQAVYDPAGGSPSEKLATDADSLLVQIAGLETRVNWPAVAADRAAALRARIPELTATVEGVRQRAETVRTDGWRGAFNDNRAAINAVSRQLGEFVLADKTGFHLWHRSPYTYVYRNALPDFSSPAVESLSVALAQDEFRDATFMVTACDQDVSLQVDVVSDEPGLTDAVQLRWSDFIQPSGGEEYGDPLVALDGPLSIPRGESRELWLTVDARWHTLPPGVHSLRLELKDLAGGTTRTFPVSLTAWDIKLPSYDGLPNNSYAEYDNTEIAQVHDQGVRHMKMYGLNSIYVAYNEMPWPVEVDANLNITRFDATVLTNRIKRIQSAWAAAPGDDRLTWILSLSGAPARLIKSDAIRFPAEQWERVLDQWLARLRELMTSLKIADQDWMLVLADESSESVLMTYEIPFAEMVKRCDPAITITCNASQFINDTQWTERFFAGFDVLQPNLDAIRLSPALRRWLGVSGTGVSPAARGRQLWTYRCESMAGVDRNLYDYYRIYAWDMWRFGITGPGIWTYCAQGQSPWGEGQRGIAYNMVYKHRVKPEVVHSRRYEFYREGMDDYRYIQTLLAASRGKGEAAEQAAHGLLTQALADITADVRDVTRCENWRVRIAEEILKLQER